MIRPLSLAALALAAPLLLPQSASAQSGGQATSPAAVQAATAPQPPAMRLGDAIRPLAYDAELTLAPERDDFAGRIAIDIEIASAADFYWINGRRLDISRATLIAGGKTVDLKIVPGGKDFIGLQLPAPAVPGKARLEFEYTGRLSRTETRGLFRQQDAGHWYIFSQFQTLSARSAFPSFDEPHWKTPWSLSLVVRRDHVAVSNMEEVASEPVGTDMKRVRFAKSAPLPSYLVALGVGPFDIVDGGTAGRNKVPLRYIVPKGRAAEAAYAVRVTPDILARLEEYFGRPYPYTKLDSLAVPVTVGFSAMENAGLITYNLTSFLATPERDNERFQRRYASIAAHEIAHQWFGNLVTMQWWTDLWLNESFATWMARKIVTQHRPDWSADEYRVDERDRALHIDRLSSTRQIRQPINVPDDLANAFDSITYNKGGAVLAMFESWLGEAAFRDGVRRYINRHEHGNASAEDFFRAVGEVDPQVARGFASFVEQPGVPKVSIDLQCKDRPVLRLRQERFLPSGRPAAGDATWTVPVCVRHSGQASASPLCTLLTAKETDWPLPEAASCPSWVLPNPAGRGYYVSAQPAALVQRLPFRELHAAESLALVNDMQLLAESAVQPVDEVLALAERVARDPRPEPVKAAAASVAALRFEWLSPAERKRLAHWIGRHFGARAHALGWLPRAGESDATRSLRRELLPLVARFGDDRKLRAQAYALAMQWLTSADKPRLGAMFEAVLRTAAHGGDRKLFDALVAAVAVTRDAGLRDQMYAALSSFEDPALQQAAFGLTLAERFDARETIDILSHASRTSRHAPAAAAFIRANYDALVARLPENYGARFAHWGGRLCTPQDKAAFASFFDTRVAALPGGKRNLAQSIEAIDICLAGRAEGSKRLKRHVAGVKGGSRA